MMKFPRISIALGYQCGWLFVHFVCRDRVNKKFLEELQIVEPQVNLVRLKCELSRSLLILSSVTSTPLYSMIELGRMMTFYGEYRTKVK